MLNLIVKNYGPLNVRHNKMANIDKEVLASQPDEISKDQKRRKLNKHEKKERTHLQCEYFIAKKNRRCCMQRKADRKYCSEHLVDNNEPDKGERVPCPLDNNHSVWSKNLTNHLKKCNAKPKENEEIWYEKDLNTKLGVDITEDSFKNDGNDNDNEDDDLNEKELYEKYIPILRNIKDHFEPLGFSISKHSGLKNRLSEVSNQKHAIQQSSLIGNMKKRGLLDINKFYLEFGCGKGELSRFVNLSVLEDLQVKDLAGKSKYGYGFIDRGVNRMKMDSKIVKDAKENTIEVNITTKRSKIDIKDLHVDKFLKDIDPEHVVVISKHLCGAATDLTFKLLLNSSLLQGNSDKFGGLLIAMCCRHVCAYDQLLPESRAFLQSKGFRSLSSFNILKKIVSWAVCGKRDGTNEESTGEHISGLTFKEREELGLVARRLIDESRVFAMNLLVNPLGFHTEMFWYVEKEITLENVCLCIIPDSN